MLIKILILILSNQLYASISYNNELDKFQYPFKVSTFKLKSQGQALKMRYMDVGSKKSTNVVLLLHGKNFSGFYWEKIAKDLVTRKLRVIIPDQVGFGKSSKPKAYQYSFGQFALNTKLLIDKLKIEKLTVVGHSMGGMLAVTMTDAYPELIKKMILINPIGLEVYSHYVDYKDTDFFYKNELGKTLEKARAYQRKNYYDGKWSDEYEKLLIPLKGMLSGKDWKLIAWNNALTYGPIFSENIVAKMPRIKTETHLVIGDKDKTGPGRGWKRKNIKRVLGDYKNLAKRAHNRIKGSKLHLLKGLGHMPQFENYKAFSEVFYPIIGQ